MVSNFAEYLTIAQTHRVFIQTIGSYKQIRDELQNTQTKTGKQVDLVCLNGHGDAEAICFGKEGPDAVYWFPYIQKQDFDAVNPTGKIILKSCYTGQYFAQQLSNITGLHVMAPISAAHGRYMRLIDECKTHGIVVIYQCNLPDSQKQAQIYRVFQPHLPPCEPCLPTDPCRR